MPGTPIEIPDEWLKLKMPDARNLKILIVDDQQSMRGMARQCLKRLGIVQVALAATADAALEQMKTQRFDAVISDLTCPG